MSNYLDRMKNKVEDLERTIDETKDLLIEKQKQLEDNIDDGEFSMPIHDVKSFIQDVKYKLNH